MMTQTLNWHRFIFDTETQIIIYHLYHVILISHVLLAENQPRVEN